jgi:beta-lactam-binding protein with PASTA domain
MQSLHETKDNRYFDAAPYLGGEAAWVVKRGGAWQRDNGYCRGVRQIVYFSGRVPTKAADCKPNEVDVPLVVGMSADGAAARLARQPLGAKVVYRPARPGRLPGVVVDQAPREGGLSAHTDVLLVVSRPRYGLIPNFVGSSLADVGKELRRLKLRYHIVTKHGPVAVVLRQSPRPGVAAAPGMTVNLVVGDGSRKASP